MYLRNSRYLLYLLPILLYFSSIEIFGSGIINIVITLITFIFIFYLIQRYLMPTVNQEDVFKLNKVKANEIYDIEKLFEEISKEFNNNLDSKGKVNIIRFISGKKIIESEQNLLKLLKKTEYSSYIQLIRNTTKNKPKVVSIRIWGVETIFLKKFGFLTKIRDREEIIQMIGKYLKD